MKKGAWLAALLPLMGSASAAGYSYTTDYEYSSQVEDIKVLGVSGIGLLIVIVLALIIAFVVLSTLKAQLKAAKNRADAANYIRDGSFELHVNQDRFLYETTQRRRIQTNTNNAPKR